LKAVTLFLLFVCVCLSGLVRSQTDTVVTYYDNKSPREIYVTDSLIKDGLYQIFYESGNLWQIGEYNKGALTGEWKVYNKNGILIQVSNYVKNKLSGKQSYYYGDSSIKQLLFYKAGRLDGIAQLYANQSLLSEGYLSEEISYKDGTKNGIYIKYNEKGDSVIVGRFISNLKSGTWSYFDDAGLHVKEEKFINNICENTIYYYNSGELKKQVFTINDSLSIQFAYYKTGELKSKLGLLHSSAHGNYIEWYKSGLKKMTGEFVENRKIGKWEFFIEEGTKKEHYYLNQ